MIKVKKILIPSVFLYLVMLCQKVHAQGGGGGGGGAGSGAGSGTGLPEAIISLPNLSRFSNLGEIAGTVITLLLTFIAVLAVGALIFGGYQYITAGGNAENSAKAKSTITWGIIGLIIAFSAYIVIDFVISRLTG